MIEPERIRFLNQQEIKDRPYVIYWMQSSQRAEYNHALIYAIDEAKRLDKDLVVYLGITDSYPQANLRHYSFMLEGLSEVKETLRSSNIRMVICRCSPEDGMIMLSRNAALAVTDMGYMRHEKSWRSRCAQIIDCPLIQVETNVIVPVETASPKEEYSAATLRSKLEKLKDRFIVLPEENMYEGRYVDEDLISELDISDTASVLALLDIDRSVGSAENFRGGTSEAKKLLDHFLEEKFLYYGPKRNEPSQDWCSNLSPYLHFGQISPLYVYIRALHHEAADPDFSESRKSFLEELFVRRELAMNFVHYNENYDSCECLPDWAKKTLAKHMADPRMYIYTREQLENALTHDEYWNAAQTELVKKGKMQGYMRMYWGKKVLEWSSSPREAYETLLYLNNRYELDGRDPNGYAGVAWCFGKHDRPWGEREIFGNVRYMAYSGLKRKFSMDRYVEKANNSDTSKRQTILDKPLLYHLY